MNYGINFNSIKETAKTTACMKDACMPKRLLPIFGWRKDFIALQG